MFQSILVAPTKFGRGRTPERSMESQMDQERFETSLKETVLVIDNDPAVGRIVELALERSGYRVMLVHDAEVGLRLAEEHRGQLDLLITDLIMPGMNGRRVAELICAEDAMVRVLFISGYTEDLLEEEDADVEDAAFLRKPFTAKQLIAKVREVIHPEKA